VKPRDAVELFLLAAVWGGSFMCIRAAVPEFGAVAVAALRVLIGAAFLAPILLLRGQLRFARGHLSALAVVGLLNAAIPFALFAWAMHSLTAGFTAILNSTAPLFTALVGYLWLRDRPARAQVAGMVLGIAGVAVLVWGRIDLRPGGTGLAIAAALAGSLHYATAANYIKRHLATVPALVTSTVSLVIAAVALAPLAVLHWPAQPPSALAWTQVGALGIAATGLGHFQYFRLVARIGPNRAITVTFLIPAFGMLWGALFLDEVVSGRMLLGCGVILLGTALVTGLLGRSRPLPSPGAAGAGT